MSLSAVPTRLRRAAVVAMAVLATVCGLVACGSAPRQPVPAATVDTGPVTSTGTVGASASPATLAAAAAAPSASAPASAPAAVRLEVVAPEPPRKLLEQQLDLARLQLLGPEDAPDDGEWARLLGVAPTQVRELLQTEGWFDPVVKVERLDPPGAGRTRVARITVETGPRVQVASFQVQVQGPLQELQQAGDADARALTAGLGTDLPLRSGRPFRNADWRDAKQQLLARLRAAGYAGVRIGDSLAHIDPAMRLANLSVTLTSGPLFRAGPLVIEGLKFHDEATVRHLAGFDTGAALTETRLLDYQDRLQKAGLFERASVSYEPDEARADATPVRVVVGELPLQQATVGVGISANTGPRTSLEHTHRRLFGRALTSYNKIEWGRDSQSLTSDFYTHPGEGFYRNLLGVQLSRVRGSSDTVLSQRLRLGRTQDTPRVERLYFAEWLRSRVDNTSGSTQATAISGNYHGVWRRLDSIVLPTDGGSLSLQGGAGWAYNNSDGAAGPFSRLYGRLTGYRPLPGGWFGQARLEAGQVFKPANVQVPDAIGFRAGGDDSVRGYGYRELTPADAAGNLRSGMVLLTGSVEIARAVSPRLPSVWWAAFFDAGRAADDWPSYRPARGYGLGIRWRSPIGPLRADLAYGQELRRVRLHLSVGIAF